jgi:hypothetical protein
MELGVKFVKETNVREVMTEVLRIVRGLWKRLSLLFQHPVSLNNCFCLSFGD